MSAPLQIPLQIRFGDIDSYGHVNNVQYLQFLEDARVQLTHLPLGDAAAEGVSPEQCFMDLVATDQFTLVGRHEIEYLAPLVYRPYPVAVNIWVTRLGSASFDYSYTVAELDGSMIYAHASTGMVLVSRITGRPERLTRAQLHALRAWQGEPLAFSRRPPVASSPDASAGASS
ncbi:acyl-CoA thioesterase [Psychromicrobium xiongbiense]|uniref:acyl-CoA thioesterase n=1 Tax=Psychromicrobium xiongbiense TaxID=3051184 RepID=UPI002553B065|nr:thioesterase family protein [Psychromicrobium sp. YIM S02556]